jgi:hypothetical protein
MKRSKKNRKGRREEVFFSILYSPFLLLLGVLQ